MILGLTGKNAAGKGEVARFLREGGFEYFSLSDEVRASLKARGLEPTRDAMIGEGRNLRSEHGLDVLARRVAVRFAPGVNRIVDSVRNPEEVRYLATLPGFFLVAVDAAAPLRFLRATARARPGDPVDIAGFLAAEARELASGDPAAQQLEATIALADFTVQNDAGIAELREAVRQVFRQAAARVPRPGWDEYFLRIADVVALRSSCAKRQVAAVVVKDRRLITTGYNGTPRGARNCSEGGCERCLSLAAPGTDLGECTCSHAEENAITQAAYHGVSLRGATVYSTFLPCVMCSKMIINSGIAEVVYRASYPLPPSAADLLSQAGVVVRKA
jgi:dCMP deaminase